MNLVRENLNISEIDLKNFISSKNNIGLISAFKTGKDELTFEENLMNHRKLKTYLSNRYEIFEMEGMYLDEDTGEYEKELSFMVINIPKKNLINLGQIYNQYAVTYRDHQENSRYYASNFPEKNIKEGDLIAKYKENIRIISEEEAKTGYGSKFLKGPLKNKWFTIRYGLIEI